MKKKQEKTPASTAPIGTHAAPHPLLQVQEVAALTGVTVRALHHYDRLGLLHPQAQSAAGYRLYSEAELEKLQQILFYRELEMPLSQIGQLLRDPAFDRRRALAQHRELLQLKKKRLAGLIALADRMLKGEKEMSFKEFDMGEIEAAKEKYAAEAKQRWGDTDAYQESKRRTDRYTKEDWAAIEAEQTDIWGALWALRERDPADPEVTAAVDRWQRFISEHFYPCSDEMLAGLGQMYLADSRFAENMDRKTGAGFTAFFAKAIEAATAPR